MTLSPKVAESVVGKVKSMHLAAAAAGIMTTHDPCRQLGAQLNDLNVRVLL